MGTTIAIVLTVILIALLFVSRRHKATMTNTRPPLPGRDPAKPAGQFHAVSIQFADSACDAAKNMEGRRFLAGAAPRIPLPGCDVLECKCRFVHHQDRRSGTERRGHYVPNSPGSAGPYSGKERRYRGDRRGNEPQNFFS